MARERPLLAREGLASRLAADVGRRISTAELVPGQRLPTEAELAAEYGVSRTVVREAISRLRADGVLNARPGAGTFVSSSGWAPPFRIEPAADAARHLADVLELRLAFEVEAARLCAIRHTAEDLASLRECLAAMAQDVSGAEAGVEADLEFHMRIAFATRNPLYRDFFAFIEPHMRREIRHAREKSARLSHNKATGRWLLAQGEHAAIVGAIEAGNPARAAAAARTHLRNTLKRLAPEKEASGLSDEGA